VRKAAIAVNAPARANAGFTACFRCAGHSRIVTGWSPTRMTKSTLRFALSMLVASGPAIAQDNAVIVVPQEAARACHSMTLLADASMGRAFSSLDRNQDGAIDDTELQAGSWQ
jgi:hypothetical protein